ncbi:hypothetical protein EMCRGX_G003471 [Ephydatia muelleri]
MPDDLSHLKHQELELVPLLYLVTYRLRSLSLFQGSWMMPLSGLVEMALFSNPAACFSSSGSVQCTKTSDSSRSITPGAGLTWEKPRDHPQSSRDSSQMLLSTL